MPLDIQGLVPNIFLDDIDKNKRNTYISQLTLITIKALLPMEGSIGNRIDYRRFKEELELWKEYYIGENISLLNKFKLSGDYDYLNYYDEVYYTRMIPIIVANKDFAIIEAEIIKNILYFSADIENLFEWLLIGLIIYLLIEGNEDIISNLKDYIIDFSQRDFIQKYKDYFQVDINRISKASKINFEKERIGLLDILYGKESRKYQNLQDILLFLNDGKSSSNIGKIIEKSYVAGDINRLDKFYADMNNYILNLRKGRIPLEDLKINEYVLPDVFSFQVGEAFYHSLLKNSKVLKKEVGARGLTSLISTKSGDYLFKRDSSN